MVFKFNSPLVLLVRMYVDFYYDADGKEEMHVVGDVAPVRSGRIVMADASTLFPAIVPRKRRTVNSLEAYSEKLHPFKVGDSRHYARVENSKHMEECIELVNLVEDGKLRGRSIFLGIPMEVVNELRRISAVCEEDNLGNWTDFLESQANQTGSSGKPSLEKPSLEKSLYLVSLPVKDLRLKYGEISNIFKSNGDFSVAMSSLILGCPLVTEDYGSFNPHSLNCLRKEYRSRWQSRDLGRYDAGSLVMSLDKLSASVI